MKKIVAVLLLLWLQACRKYDDVVIVPSDKTVYRQYIIQKQIVTTASADGLLSFTIIGGNNFVFKYHSKTEGKLNNPDTYSIILFQADDFLGGFNYTNNEMRDNNCIQYTGNGTNMKTHYLTTGNITGALINTSEWRVSINLVLYDGTSIADTALYKFTEVFQ
ncbi:MAG: hypothetical protein JNK00_12850 [Flavipsychrobacter sp.]|nr:hypothetical protein [Flavipsychrobacter sp.]